MKMQKKITSSRNDTLFLSPKTFTLNDIIVQSRNLNWIQHLLKQIVNKKDSLYKINDNTLSYNFISKSLTDSTLYQFNSIGYMRYPDYKGKQSFTICPIKNVMKTNIEGADGDFAQISRSVYHSFINDFDHDFIKNTDFKLISFADENLSGLLKFSYISKRHPDHTGFFIVDTLQKAIIEFEQKAGSDYNIKNNTTAITRILASNRGFKYKLWETTIYGKYKKLNDKYYMSECRYQYFVQTENKNKVYFSNIESTLALKESDFYNTNNCKWMELPSPYSILIIKSKSRRIAEEALIQVPLIIEDL